MKYIFGALYVVKFLEYKYKHGKRLVVLTWLLVYILCIALSNKSDVYDIAHVFTHMWYMLNFDNNINFIIFIDS